MKTKLLSFLYRKTSSGSFIPEVDGFRFFAIATVVLYHLNTHFARAIASVVDVAYYKTAAAYQIASEGGIGVNVFFSISGFILALPFAKQHLFNSKRVDLKAYFIRRLTRLEPPYIICLVIFLFMHVWVLHEAFKDVLPNFWASLFYVHNIVYDKWSKINPVAWSLEVEVQFYILAPLLALVFSISNLWTRRVLITSIILISIFHYNFNYEWIERLHLRKSLLMHLHQFFVGFMMADIYLVSWKSDTQKRNFLWDIVGVAAMISVLTWNDTFRIEHDLIFSVSLLLAFMSVFKGVLLNRFFSLPAVVIIGGMCYTIYLFHYVIIAFMTSHTLFLFNSAWSYSMNYLVQALFIVPVVLFLSAIYFVLIERPCMDKEWPQKLKTRIGTIFNKR